jgi:hypothetical protein
MRSACDTSQKRFFKIEESEAEAELVTKDNIKTQKYQNLDGATVFIRDDPRADQKYGRRWM